MGAPAPQPFVDALAIQNGVLNKRPKERRKCTGRKRIFQIELVWAINKSRVFLVILRAVAVSSFLRDLHVESAVHTEDYPFPKVMVEF